MRFTLTLLLAGFPMILGAADPFLGVWKLNPQKSKFEPGPAPRSLTVAWTVEDGGIKVASAGTRADGRAIDESYVAIYDGKEHSKPGPWNFDSVINRQISENEREDIFKKRGAVVGSARYVISADGKEMVNTWSYGELRDLRVFDRQ
jgi:hypothetical protein